MKYRNHIVLFLLLLHVALLCIVQFTTWPEMLAYPYLINKGFSFYGDIIHPYFPTLPYLLLSFFKITGFTPLALQLFTTVLILSSDVLFWFVAKQLYSKKTATFLLAAFIP